MAFPTITVPGCFPELRGLVLLDPQRLDAFYGGAAAQRNLLERLTTTDEGERITADGIAIPLLQLEDGYYTVVVRHVDAGGMGATPSIRSTGWVLGTQTGSLLVVGLGYLACWDPHQPRHARLVIEPGWYQVEIRGFIAEPPAQDDGIYELVLSPAIGQPRFTASLEESFNLFR